jgi:hypothetical protein
MVHHRCVPSDSATVAPRPDLERLAVAADLQMLVVIGGRERTEAQYAELFAGAGLQLTRVVALESTPWSVIEGRPV